MKEIKKSSNGYKRRFIDRHSSFVLMAPYAILFCLFIVIPVGAAIVLSFTNFNAVSKPTFAGFSNYINLLTNDSVFMQYVLPNTVIYSIFVGMGGYILSFFVAWSLSQIPKKPRTIMTVILYSPSVTGGVLLSTIWSSVFSGDKRGLLNYALLKLDIIDTPIQWLQSTDYLLPIMIIVGLWSSMGIGFLAILSGILNVDPEIYEAARIDGVKNRLQEIIYVTIPSIKPQMLFGAVMAIVNTFKDGGTGVTLSGANPTPGYAGQLIANHIDDYGFIRYEMGYAAAVSTVLLIMIYILSRVVGRVFSSADE